MNSADDQRFRDIEIKINKLEIKMGIVYEWFKDSKRLLWTILAGVLLALILNVVNLTNDNSELLRAVQKMERHLNGDK